jgi:hypothetical protein
MILAPCLVKLRKYAGIFYHAGCAKQQKYRDV